MRNWCFTDFQLTADYASHHLIVYLVYQPERCPSTGLQHMQGYVEFKDKISASAAGRAMGRPLAKKGQKRDFSFRLVEREGTRDQARAYCMSTTWCHGCHTGKSESLQTSGCGCKDGIMACGTNTENLDYHEKDKGVLGPFVEYGKWRCEGRPPTDADVKKRIYSRAVELAKEGSVVAAMDHIQSEDPREFLLNGKRLRENLEGLVPPKRRFLAPDLSGAKLRMWQQVLYEMLLKDPVPRRIIWVSSEKPNLGKSFVLTYMQQVYPFGVYEAGECVSLDKVVYGYSGEGVIAWDFPMNFEWEKFETPMAAVIEKFSDFGQRLASKKYGCKSSQIQGHVVVFSNRNPPESLAHRDVFWIHALDKVGKCVINMELREPGPIDQHVGDIESAGWLL